MVGVANFVGRKTGLFPLGFDRDGIRYLRLTSYETSFFGNFAVSGLRVFGSAGGDKPAAAGNCAARRDAKDPCSFTLSWDAAEGADGYNVKWGIAPWSTASQVLRRTA